MHSKVRGSLPSLKQVLVRLTPILFLNLILNLTLTLILNLTRESLSLSLRIVHHVAILDWTTL
jgi:hypothetical protein